MPADLLLVDACQAGGKRRIARDWAILAARHLWQIGLMAHVVRVADMRARLEALHLASEQERTASAEDPRLREVLVMTGYTDERLLRLRDVKEKTGLGSSTIYRRIADGTFPVPRSLGPNTVRWLQSEIDAWIRSLPSSRGGTAAGAAG
jgi:prophage regulatory protein